MKKQWVDGPFKMIETPQKTMDKSNKVVLVATGMALAHNSFFRALNAIYLQAAGVSQPQDISDFLVYCRCFFEMVSHHHDKEEELLFPAIAEYTGKPDIMEGNVAAHAEFHGGLERLGRFAYEMKPDFAVPFEKHMDDEINSLLALETYGGDKLLKAHLDFETKLIASADKYRLHPFVFGSQDTTMKVVSISGPRFPSLFFMLSGTILNGDTLGLGGSHRVTLLGDQGNCSFFPKTNF